MRMWGGTAMTSFSYRIDQYPQTGWKLIHLFSHSGDGASVLSELALTPEIGSNLLSFCVGGVDYLCDVARKAHGHAILGTPVLYPTPDRVRNATFTFDGRTFTFRPNAGAEFVHGLVRHEPWDYDTPVVAADGISVTTRIVFAPGKPTYDRFPIRNMLELTFTLRETGMRFDFTVCNQDPSQRLPFGLGIHPYLRIHGPRESVRIQVPGDTWQDVNRADLLPSGRLLPVEQAPADLRTPTSLGGLDIDDLFRGLRPDAPQRIFYDHLGAQVTVTASEFFVYTPVYTPVGNPFFCVETQSCSTDAHNLYARGYQDVAHLAILDPGQILTAWIEFAVNSQ
jgi:aldose 1-epimerase